VVEPLSTSGRREETKELTGLNIVIFKSVFPKLLMILSILGVSVIAGAQTQATEGASLPQRGSEKYWLVVDEFADRAVHLAYAKRFVQLHEGSLTARQCQQYSMIAIDFRDELAASKQAGVSAQSEFWSDVRAYATGMIGAPGVPIPVHRTSKYRVMTGSEAEDGELRRLVSLEIDSVSSQLILTDGYSPSALKTGCLAAGQDTIIKAQR
jgi:hypothetical protein